MQEVSKDIFYQLIADFEWIPFTQTLAYNLSIVPEESLHFFIDDMEHPLLGCVGYARSKPALKMLCVGGECRRSKEGTDRKRYVEFYQAIHETGFDIYELNLNTPYAADAEIALRTAGYLRPIGMFSTALSKIIHTTEAIPYDKSWKRNLKKGHEAELKWAVVEHVSEEHIANYIRHHEDLLQRKGFHEGLTAQGLRTLLQDPHFKMCLITNPSGETVGGGIFYVQANASVTLYSFSTTAGRESGAAYLFYEGIIGYLAQQGIQTLDVGRISPCTHKKQNIFLFKDGIGGEYVQYLGEWEYCRKKWLSVLLYFAKQYIWKRVRV